MQMTAADYQLVLLLALRHVLAIEWMHPQWGPGFCGACECPQSEDRHRTDCHIGATINTLKPVTQTRASMAVR